MEVEERKFSAVIQVGESDLEVNSNICLREKEQGRDKGKGSDQQPLHVK